MPPGGQVGTYPNTTRPEDKAGPCRSGMTENSLETGGALEMGIHQTKSSCFDTLPYSKVENKVLRMPEQKLPSNAFLKYFYFVSGFSACYILFCPTTWTQL